MRMIIVEYSIGYESHTMDLEAEDDMTDAEIEKMVHEFVRERLEWSWKFEER